MFEKSSVASTMKHFNFKHWLNYLLIENVIVKFLDFCKINFKRLHIETWSFNSKCFLFVKLFYANIFVCDVPICSHGFDQIYNILTIFSSPFYVSVLQSKRNRYSSLVLLQPWNPIDILLSIFRHWQPAVLNILYIWTILYCALMVYCVLGNKQYNPIVIFYAYE